MTVALRATAGQGEPLQMATAMAAAKGMGHTPSCLAPKTRYFRTILR
jgi:hypothetical protein